MPVNRLLAKLAKIRVNVAETRTLPDGRTIYVLVAELPAFPFGRQQRVWYPLIIEPQQTDVPREEVEAILRHLWHAEMDFFSDEPPGFAAGQVN